MVLLDDSHLLTLHKVCRLAEGTWEASVKTDPSYLDTAVSYFSPNSGGIASRVAELNAALDLVTRAKK